MTNRDKFLINTRQLLMKEDFENNIDLLKNLRPYYYEGVDYLLRLGHSVKGAVKGAHEIFVITQQTNLCFEDFKNVASRFDKISLYRQLK